MDHLDYLFSLEDADRDSFYSNPETRYTFLEYEFKARITQCDDFEESWSEEQAYWKQKFAEDKKALDLIENALLLKRNSTHTNTQ